MSARKKYLPPHALWTGLIGQRLRTMQFQAHKGDSRAITKQLFDEGLLQGKPTQLGRKTSLDSDIIRVATNSGLFRGTRTAHWKYLKRQPSFAKSIVWITASGYDLCGITQAELDAPQHYFTSPPKMIDGLPEEVVATVAETLFTEVSKSSKGRHTLKVAKSWDDLLSTKSGLSIENFLDGDDYEIPDPTWADWIADAMRGQLLLIFHETLKPGRKEAPQEIALFLQQVHAAKRGGEMAMEAMLNTMGAELTIEDTLIAILQRYSFAACAKHFGAPQN